MIETHRLILREWHTEDLEPFAQLNADPRVMEYFPHPLTKEQSDALAHRKDQHIREKGWGLWAVSVPSVAEFIGFIGLDEVSFSLPFAPAIEVGWRLAFDHWGKGYAAEGAKASLRFGFEILGLDEIVSFTSIQNRRSQRVMEKIGMHRNPLDDFDHPKLPLGHPLLRHVLYRIDCKMWHAKKRSKSDIKIFVDRL